jgi:hypothetical protein
MSEDIDQRTNLQALLEDNPEIEPIQFIDGDKLVTLMVESGVPILTQSAIAESSDYNLPSITELNGAPVCRIYSLLRTLKFLDGDRNQEGAAAILSKTSDSSSREHQSEELGKEIQFQPPFMPPSSERIASAVSGNTDMENRPDHQGMYGRLESLEQRFRELLKTHPHSEPMRLRTAKEKLEISVIDGTLRVQPTCEPCQPYLDVRDAPQVRLYMLDRTIQSLERKLYGQISEIKVLKSSGKSKAQEKLACALTQVDCGRLSILIRRSRKTLFLSGPERHIIYGDLKVALTAQDALREEEGSAPVDYAETEFGVLRPNVRQVLKAFFAYLSTRSGKRVKAP